MIWKKYFFFFRNHLIDNVVIFFFASAVIFAAPFVSLVTAPMYNRVSKDLIIHQNLLPPLNKISLVISYILFCVGILLLITGFSLENIAANVTFSSIFATLLIPFFAMSLSLTHWFSNSFIVSIWLTKFIAKCKFIASELNNTVGKVQEILLIYQRLDQTLGFYFAFCFSLFQLNWIVILYCGVTAYFSGYETGYTILFSSGAILIALGGM